MVEYQTQHLICKQILSKLLTYYVLRPT